MITIYSDATRRQVVYGDINVALKRIAGLSNKNSKDAICEIRRLSATINQDNWRNITKQVDPIKKKLVAYCFSGKFNKLGDSGLIEHSGLICLDFDVKFKNDGVSSNLGPHTAEEFRELMSQLRFVYAAFISPSGLGVKVLVRVPPVITGHRGHFKALERYFTQNYYGTDPTSINESRLCFDSYDPDIYVNPNCEVWTDYDSITFNTQDTLPVLIPKQINDYSNFSAIQLVVDIIQNSVPGERHQKVIKAGRLAGGYLASGAILQKDIHIIEDAVRAKFQGEDVNIEIRALHDGIKNGISLPISHNQIAGDVVINEVTNGVIRASSQFEQMRIFLRDGKPKGRTTLFPDLDVVYKFKEGELTLITGFPQSGKTTFAMQLNLIQSLAFGSKWAIFSPENYPAYEFYDTIVEMLTGKSTDIEVGRRFGMQRMVTEEEYRAAVSWVDNHFFFIYPETSHSIDEIEANATYLMRHEKITGIVIDPFNQLDHGNNRENRDDLYIGKFAAARQRYARENGLHYQLIVHPNRLETYKNPNAGGRIQFKVPGYYDLNGGPVWSAKIDNMLAIDRPGWLEDKKDTAVDFHSIKIKKQKLVGLPGMSSFRFDVRDSRYYDGSQFNPIDGLVKKLELFNEIRNDMGIMTPHEMRIAEGDSPW